MKRINALWLVLICLIISNNLHSSPYEENLPLKVEQPDGTIITVYFTGAKGGYYYTYRFCDEDNFTILEDNETGVFCWAKQDSDGWLKSTGYAVHLYNPKDLGLKPGESMSKERAEERYNIWIQTGKVLNYDGTLDLFSSKNPYAVGDTGPAGGIIFYDKGPKPGDYWEITDYDFDWRYLEAAPATAEFSSVWGLFETEVTGTDISIGSGQQNTDILVNLGDVIVDFIDGNGDTVKIGGEGTAAMRCQQLEINGYKDWFLPSRDELDCMQKVLFSKGLGDFSEDEYWSSSVGGNGKTGAWYQQFSDGYQNDFYIEYGHSRTSKLKVRAIRAF